jgi:hypothetical protein
VISIVMNNYDGKNIKLIIIYGNQQQIQNINL